MRQVYLVTLYQEDEMKDLYLGAYGTLEAAKDGAVGKINGIIAAKILNTWENLTLRIDLGELTIKMIDFQE